ncbi:Bor/Iss family lipoprotein [Peijinzhouia sedimentorum]
MKKKASLFFAGILLAASLSSCMSLTHTVGSGGYGESETKRQWYVLWGLVPINEVDSKAMASGAENYTVKSSITPLDFIINIFTGVITVYSQTVEVKK